MGGALQASLVFDGTNEFVSVGDVADLRFLHTDSFSFVAWFRTCSAGNEIIIAKRLNAGTFRGYTVFTNLGGVGLQLVNTTGSNLMQVITTAATFDDAQWHQVIATWTGVAGQSASNATIFIDGASEALTVNNDTLSATIEGGGLFQIGGLAGVFNWDGNIAGVVVYDKKLTSVEVTTLYNSGTPVDHNTVGPTGNLVEYWLLGTGDTFPTNTAVNGNDGTMTNMEAGDIVLDSPGAGGETIPPTIDNFSPAVGSAIQRNTPISFDVKDNVALRRAILMVPVGTTLAVIHDGDAFRSGFGTTNPATGQPFSSRAAITGGFRYTVQNPSGWNVAPVFEVAAIDTSGNEAS